MRNTEERAAAVKQRAKEMQRQKHIRRSRIVMVSSAAACLFIIVGLSLAMPGIIAGMPESEYAHFGAAAGIFNMNGAFGYVLIGLLAFVLGVSVTILGYRIRLKNLRNRVNAGGSDG